MTESASLPWRGTPPVLIIGGVCLTGKTSLARRIEAAAEFPVEFIEGDSLHERRSIAKMARGEALDHSDRTVWRERICERIRSRPADRLRILSCSALGRPFRDALRAAGGLRFVFLLFSREQAEMRAAKRLREQPGHYFQPARHPALLDGQYRDLQRPSADERDCRILDLDAAPKGPDGPRPDFDALAPELIEWFLGSLNLKS